MIDKNQIKNLPEATGIYIFRDKNENVLYIGKAINIKKRVKNYFEKNFKEERIINLLKEAEKIDFIILNSELEALLLEARLIKQYQPKYNVRLKDDKRYLYAGISKEIYPRVFVLRLPEKSTNLEEWFGPFPSAESIREILRLLRRIFPFRSCRKIPKTVCLYYHLNLCPGMCQYPVDSSEYQKNIQKLKIFLKGEVSFLIKKLKKEMHQEAKKQNFEKALVKKKQITMIQNMILKYKKFTDEEEKGKSLDWLRKILAKYQNFEPLIIHRLEAYDVANLGKDIIVGSMVVFINGEPDFSEYRRFKIKEKQKGDPQFLGEVIKRRFKHQEWLFPQLILVDGGKSQTSSVFKILKEKDLVKKIGLIGLVKEEEKLIIPIFDKPKTKILKWKIIKFFPGKKEFFILLQARDEAHRFAQNYYKELHRKKVFSGRE